MNNLSNENLAEICSALFEVATEGIIIVDNEGKIAIMNPSAEELFQYAADDLRGQRVEVLIPQKRRSGHEKHRQKYNENPTRRKMGMGMDLYGLRQDGSEIPIEISLSHFPFNEQKFTMALITDISARKASEQEVLKAKEDLENKVKERTKELENNIERRKQAELEIQKAYEQEKELNELKSRFVSMASHEFKTPLANILTSATLIDKYQKTEQAKNRLKHVGKIKRSVNTLNAILNDFLSLDRLESGANNFNLETFDVIELCREITDQVDLLLKENQNIALNSPSEKIKVTMDRSAMKHIIANLLSNGIKYSGENNTIFLSLEHTNGMLKLSVRDEGIGIPIDEQKNIFSKFFRAKNSLNIQGTGLGLHIIRHYVELMNGSIKFSSEEGKGTTFFIEIPCEV